MNEAPHHPPPLPVAERENQLADQERWVLEQEQQLRAREQTWVRRHTEQAEAEDFLRRRLETLSQWSQRLRLGPDPQPRLQELHRAARLFPALRSSGDEIARAARLETLELREVALERRLTLLTEFQRQLEEQEQAFGERHRQLRQLEEELASLSQRLTATGAPVASPPTDGRARTVAETWVDEQLRQRGAIALPVAPLQQGQFAASTEAERRVGGPRIGLRVAITYTSQHNLYSASTFNISRGGLFIATERVLPVGERVALEFSLPDSQPIRTPGEVSWIRERDGTRLGMGIRFLDLQPAARRALDEFMVLRAPIQVP